MIKYISTLVFLNDFILKGHNKYKLELKNIKKYFINLTDGKLLHIIFYIKIIKIFYQFMEYLTFMFLSIIN